MRLDSNKTFELDDWRRGDPTTARHFQQPITALKRLTRGVAVPRQRPAIFKSNATGADAGVASGIRTFYVISTRIDFDSWNTNDGAIHVLAPRILTPQINTVDPSQGTAFYWDYASWSDSLKIVNASTAFGGPGLTQTQWSSMIVNRLVGMGDSSTGRLTRDEHSKIMILQSIHPTVVGLNFWNPARLNPPWTPWMALPLMKF